MFLLKDVSKLEEPGVVVNGVVTSKILCWPTIHGMLEIINMETINDYSKRMYKYATEKEVNTINEKAFLASCISHSTH